MAETIEEVPVTRTGIARHPVTPFLLPVPIVCFVGALITDLAYDSSGGNLQWVNFSSWLLAAGLFFGGIVALLMVIDLVRIPQLRSSDGWAGFALLIAAWVVELINSFVHARDGWTAVVPLGLILSAIGALQILIFGWLWHETRYEGERP
jgi:uncharacterized membrane protein